MRRQKKFIILALLFIAAVFSLSVSLVLFQQLSLDKKKNLLSDKLKFSESFYEQLENSSDSNINSNPGTINNIRDTENAYSQNETQISDYYYQTNGLDTSLSASVNVFASKPFGQSLLVLTEDLGKSSWNISKVSCTSLGAGWRLPTIDELQDIYQNASQIGGFSTSAYWSLISYDSKSANILYFNNGSKNNVSLNLNLSVRCVKSTNNSICFDGDNQKSNYYTKSYVKSKEDSIFYDYCIDNRLYEGICGFNIQDFGYTSTYCALGCVNGACIRPVGVTCVNGTAANDYYHAGFSGDSTVYGWLSRDNCINSSIMRKGSCSPDKTNTDTQWEYHFCPNGCNFSNYACNP